MFYEDGWPRTSHLHFRRSLYLHRKYRLNLCVHENRPPCSHGCDGGGNERAAARDFRLRVLHQEPASTRFRQLAQTIWPSRANARQFPKLRPSDSPVPILNGADFRNIGIKLNEKDIVRAKELLSYEWFQKPVWQAEIKRMLTCGPAHALAALATKTSSTSRRHIFQ